MNAYLHTAILLLVALATVATIASLAIPVLRKDPRQTRMKAIAKRREQLSRQQFENLKQEKLRRLPNKHINWMRSTLEKFKLENLASSSSLRQKLANAGWRQPSATVYFVFARFAMAVTGAFLATVFMTMISNTEHPWTIQATVAVFFAAAGFMLPGLLVKNVAMKRQHEMRINFPDAMDLMTICVESGLSIEQAFVRVTEEIAEKSPVLAEELGLTSAELAFLGERRKAFENFAKRTGLPAVKALSTTLIQSERYGTAISQALQVLAQENRDERMSAAEKKAAALPAQLTVPMVVFFLPVLFLVIIGPAIIQVMQL